MFPFPFCCGPKSFSYADMQKHKLNMLKAVRNSLETRLAATNAAIATLERQVADSDGGVEGTSEAA
ncbi:MAG: hypothetical protein HC812_11155 [Leptolyngbya sp. RL_3_1]|nr:hypothetical protein [Leptolyngbya sp. RL_3_1]